MIRDYAEPLGKNKSPRVILEKKDKSKTPLGKRKRISEIKAKKEFDKSLRTY